MESTCIKCGSTKSEADFSLSRSSKTGRRGACKSCESSASRGYRAMHLEACRATNRQYQKSHPEKNRASCRLWAKRHPESAKDIQLRTKFGITIAEYNQMLSLQDGVCGICGKTETVTFRNNGIPKALAVDHDHKTGRVRGLLCQRCNHMLGNLETIVGAGGHSEIDQVLHQILFYCKEK